MGELLKAAGLMCGTSMDAVDVAVIETDGEAVVRRMPELAASIPLDEPARALIRRAMAEVAGAEGPQVRTLTVVEEAARAVTRAHWVAESALLAASATPPQSHECGLARLGIEVVGFHGQTILHRPDRGFTLQIGDGAMLADLIGVPVIDDFRSNDMANGGQGAPLVPVYHRALTASAGLEAPVAILNIGGVANVTWIGPGDELIAFDTGPGNALIDDHMRRVAGEPCDRDGQAAARGQLARGQLAALMSHPYFASPAPKSLDRQAFHGWVEQVLETRGRAGGADRAHALEDDAALLTAFTVEAVAAARDHFPTAPARWLVCGGGASNPTLMRWLADRLAVPVEPVERLGWSGEHMEAEAFAYLAVRSLRGLPLSFPGTTGVAAPTSGGRLSRPRRRP
ncbi:MAG: anhydro-N-acetylmuramic acid kinase [Rhizobiales bacterium]|nr:anhydro-N-acetylmuramic acid kinase [Hyphomicrobiales bacterium]